MRQKLSENPDRLSDGLGIAAGHRELIDRATSVCKLSGL
jgi:hypothetical protein